MDDNDFINDPLFSSLRKFSSTVDESQIIPANIRSAFRDGIKASKKRRFAWRGAIGAGLMVVAFPTFAAAKILPAPLQHIVENINRVITSPVTKIIDSVTPPKKAGTHRERFRNVTKSPRDTGDLNLNVELGVDQGDQGDFGNQDQHGNFGNQRDQGNQGKLDLGNLGLGNLDLGNLGLGSQGKHDHQGDQGNRDHQGNFGNQGEQGNQGKLDLGNLDLGNKEKHDQQGNQDKLDLGNQGIQLLQGTVTLTPLIPNKVLVKPEEKNLDAPNTLSILTSNPNPTSKISGTPTLLPPSLANSQNHVQHSEQLQSSNNEKIKQVFTLDDGDNLGQR